MGIVGNIIIISATIFAIVSRDTTSPGLAGLSLTFALSVISFSFIIKLGCNFELVLVFGHVELHGENDSSVGVESDLGGESQRVLENTERG